jgi:CheY-like chemotaxis protein
VIGVMILALNEPHEAVVPRKLRILIVDDHAPTRIAMTRLISATGVDVIAARDGEEALGYLLTQRFDVLLTDLRMPVMDGFELMQHALRLPPLHRPSRIIAISGEYEAGALRSVPVPFLAEPLDVDALLEMLGGSLN